MLRAALLILLCAACLVGDSVVPALLVTETQTPCRFTLERSRGQDAAEIWTLTCHRRDLVLSPAGAVSLKPAAVPVAVRS
jgi:hypothetical protein